MSIASYPIAAHPIASGLCKEDADPPDVGGGSGGNNAFKRRLKREEDEIIAVVSAAYGYWARFPRWRNDNG